MVDFRIKPRVSVIMSSYNGAVYIEEQIYSILNQSLDAEIDIHIRDDGSTDSTLELIKSMSEINNNIYLYEGNNIGVVGSFLWLVENISGYDYYAFCDQDDVWHPLKLAAAIDKLIGNGPRLYCSAYEYVDCNLNVIGRFTSKTDLSMNNLLIENCAPGCTMVFNSSLRDEYIKLDVDINDMKNIVVMHDWLFLLLAVCTGSVLYDENSYLLYRQHANNVVGIKSGILSIAKNRWRQYKKERSRKNHLLFLQASFVKGFCGDLVCSHTSKVVVDKFIDSQSCVLSRVLYMLGSGGYRVRRIKVLDGVLFWFLYLFGYYK